MDSKECHRFANCTATYLIFSIIGLCGASCTLLTLNASDEKISWSKGLFITSMGLIFFASLAESIETTFYTTIQGQTIQRRYHLLRSDTIEITNKAVSAIQAILSSAAGAVVCNSSCRRSFLKASHFMSDAYAWFGAAYFIYDMWHMYRSYASKIADKILLIDRNTNKCNGRCRSNENNNLSPCIDCMDKYGVHLSHAEIADRFKDISSQPINFLQFCSLHPVMIIHHIFLGSFGLLVIVYLRGNFGDCVYSFMYLMELSTPFVSVRSILSILGLKDSLAYVINGIFMLVTFFFCRILMWPMLYIWYSRIVNKSVIQAIMSLPLSCKIGTLILFLPQVYWFYLMIRGAIKILFQSKTSKNLKTT